MKVPWICLHERCFKTPSMICIFQGASKGKKNGIPIATSNKYEEEFARLA